MAGAARALRGARRVAFLTGAGVSTASGIPTYRGAGGLWRGRDPSALATVGAFRADPAGVWEWYEDRRRNAREAAPNAGHAAIAAAEGFLEVDVLTQNVDGLHQRAGSTRVIELHGNIARTRCDSCGRPGGDGAFADLPPRCAGCGGILRPDVVWFGEPLPAAAWEAARRAAGRCDAMVVAGTSLEVSPANSLPAAASAAGALIVEVNPEGAGAGGLACASVPAPAARALPELLGLAREGRG